MDVATVLSVAQTLFSAIQNPELRELCSFLNYKSQLDSLAETVTTVKAVLLDADSKRELTNEAQLYIERLKDAVYDADDLLDEFVTLAQRKHNKFKQVGKVSDKVRSFFSQFKDLGVAYRMSQGVKAMKKQLDAIADDHTKFGLKLDSEPIRKRREDTCAYVYAQGIIGRDVDKEKIVGMLLLDSNVKRDDVSFLTIVGMGGLGKTALAQLICNDERITKHFSQRLWVCVADEDPKHLSMQAVLAKIVESSEGHNHGDSSKEWLQNQVRGMLHGKKYLLVLDDVWNENRDDWLELENFLKGGSSGSWVLVTTRSENTAKVIGDGSWHPLKGLSDKDSWCLFQRAALGHNEDQANSTDLEKIGKDIVRKCGNVPLALKVVGSLLYGHGKEKWLSFQKTSFAGIIQNQTDILQILKLSYDNLDSPLKACFSYCALFPKDYEIKKETLINLWMAQGYVEQSNEGESIADTSEEYFTILLRRCFFQDIKKNEYEEIISFKIHDFMHDVAQQVTRNEISLVNCVASNLDEKIRHFSTEKGFKAKGSTKIKARTFLQVHCIYKYPAILRNCNAILRNCNAILVNWMYLRALDLRRSDIGELPDSIGELLHLRYIDLSDNWAMKVLPKSITKLHNLQTLNLYGCKGLVELPKTLSKLNKLMSLNTYGCERLTNMPLGMGRLSCLCNLPFFVVDATNSGYVELLESLEALTKLKGHLGIKIDNSKKAGKYVKREGSERGGCLINKQHLKEIKFCFEKEWLKNEVVEYEEALMEEMQPHPNLRGIRLHDYYGAEMPRWAKLQNFADCLPNLVTIQLRSCFWLQHIPLLGGLRHLRILMLVGLGNLEYIEENIVSDVGGSASEKFPFFPSLVKLLLVDLPKLKGWWRGVESSGVGDDAYLLLPSFPCLSELCISSCPRLSCIPLCCPTSLEFLELTGFNENIRIMERGGERSGGRDGERTPTLSSPSTTDFRNFKLAKITTSNGKYLNRGLPMQAFRCLTELSIYDDSGVERLEEVGEVLKTCSSSLKTLVITRCQNLRSLNGGLEQLTALEELHVENCQNLKLDNGHFPLLHNLRRMTLVGIPLVEGMQHLSSLRSLEVHSCDALESLPEWMPNLTSLQYLQISSCKALESLPLRMPNLTRLTIWDCSEALKQRCSKTPPGEYWPIIQHIPRIHIS